MWVGISAKTLGFVASVVAIPQIAPPFHYHFISIPSLRSPPPHCNGMTLLRRPFQKILLQARQRPIDRPTVRYPCRSVASFPKVRPRNLNDLRHFPAIMFNLMNSRWNFLRVQDPDEFIIINCITLSAKSLVDSKVPHMSNGSPGSPTHSDSTTS